MLRNWLLARDARKLARRSQLPQTITRTYWTAGDYEQDSVRLATLGYRVSHETSNAPHVVVHLVGRTGYRGGRVVRRRVPIFHVTYTQPPAPRVATIE